MLRVQTSRGGHKSNINKHKVQLCKNEYAFVLQIELGRVDKVISEE